MTCALKNKSSSPIETAKPEEAVSPHAIAREALRQLAALRIPPTPENYQKIYDKIAGISDKNTFPSKQLEAILQAFPRKNATDARLAQQFEKAIKSGQWSQLQHLIIRLAQLRTTPHTQEWGKLISDLITLIERNSQNLTRAQKREALQHVLTASAGNTTHLFNRLRGLLNGWQQAPLAQHVSLVDEPVTTPAQTHSMASAIKGSQPVAPVLALLMRNGIYPFISDSPELSTETVQLANELLGAIQTDTSHELIDRLKTFTSHLELAGESRLAIHRALVSVLHLIVENISKLVLDDSWLNGQLAILSELFASPLDIRMLDDIENRLRDVIERQGQLKQDLSGAQERLKTMLTGFIDRLANFSTTTDEYQITLSRCAAHINAAQDITELSNAVEEILSQTRSVQETTQRSKEELDELRQQVEIANNRIIYLQRELNETSEMVRHDPLTGTLNRKGIDEAFIHEIEQMRRNHTCLSIALLDIDNFKRLNDTFGHTTGDEALRHLSQIMRASLRPQDNIGRYGGEEFLILLPETSQSQAREIIIRLQRELTRQLFLADGQKLLITFSAGISAMEMDEHPQDVIERADKAMYMAKRAGKNRVFISG